MKQKDASRSLKEPPAVIIRKYGGRVISESRAKKDLRPVTEIQELLIINALSREKLMPRLLGLFDGGRIEEFIDCRPMTGKDTADPDIMSDLAKNMARIHALDVPMPNPGYNFMEVLWKLWNSYLSENPTDRTEDDFTSELKWLEPLLHHDHHRIVMMNWDPHFSNVSIRTNPKEGELKTIIFDFEMAGYNMRGKDLGLLFLAIGGSTAVDRDPQFPLHFEFASTEICRMFFDLYLKECENHFDDIDRNGIDSFDHLMIESLLGGMVSCLCFLFVHLRWEKQVSASSMGDFAGKMSVMKKGIRDSYFKCKKLLHELYPEYKKILGCKD